MRLCGPLDGRGERGQTGNEVVWTIRRERGERSNRELGLGRVDGRTLMRYHEQDSIGQNT